VHWMTVVYGVRLAKALRSVEKLVPATALDKGTPLAAWCECRPVVRAAAEAAERRTEGGTVDAASWRAVERGQQDVVCSCVIAFDVLGQLSMAMRQARLVRGRHCGMVVWPVPGRLGCVPPAMVLRGVSRPV